MGLLDFFNKDKGVDPVKSEEPRAPRVQIIPLHSIAFDQAKPTPKKGVLIANLSESGVGFIKDSQKSWPKPKSKIKGTFHYRNEKQTVGMKVVHVSPKVVGCQFTDHLEEMEKFVNKYFNLELRALKMFQVKPEMLAKRDDGYPQWFRGDDNCELYLVTREARIVHFHITFFGNYLEGGQDEPTRLGHIVNDELESDEIKYKGSELVRQTSSFPAETAEQAIKFIRNIRDLEMGHKNMICQIIEDAPKKVVT